MDHLVFLGHQRLGMIEAVDLDQPTEPSGRSAAYRDSLAEAKLPHDPVLVVSASWGGEQGAEAMSALLSLKDPPTAVYAHSDEVAVGATRSIRRAGLRIPEDISLVGIYDHPIAALVDLTTVGQPVHAQFKLAAKLVLDLLEGKTLAGREITVPTQLVMRSTTAPPRSAR